jgi:hypothetical protein
VTQSSELTGLLQQLIQQHREDMLTAEEAHRAAEEARKASEARFAQLQQEATHNCATADERFVGLLDCVTQQQDAQIQQMQQGMFAMFGMVQQLVTHTGLVPQQQAGLQGMSAPALAPTLTPATTSTPGIVPSPAGISYSALFSPPPQVSLFQSPARPTLPSEAAVSQQQQQPSAQPSVQQAPPQPQQQTQPEHTASPSDNGDDDPSRFIAVSHPPAP